MRALTIAGVAGPLTLPLAPPAAASGVPEQWSTDALERFRLPAAAELGRGDFSNTGFTGKADFVGDVDNDGRADAIAVRCPHPRHRKASSSRR
ncbi:hypothetical protein CFP75_38455 [Amycolatopsis alba DSM 44262]|uniref:Uncharacterized protein n=1 Tax=Amycolatopsis alba DSM 44262 TaxID=1125972 RepID=A0A229R9X4_AMYAL|nr:hypothetical protein CFP75_38455 [Amycolatopsis alba DSM 44262]